MRSVFALALLALLSAVLVAQNTDYTRWVNPFIGTGGHGHTFPGAVLPFGMVQLSPDTRGADWDGSSGYHYSDDVIYGFSHTHLSGTGIPDGCDILFMPTMGKPGYFNSLNGLKDDANRDKREWYVSKFSHANEKAEPGYYSVRLDNSGIVAELTATNRVGLHRYTFPDAGNANVVLDLLWRDKLLDSSIKVVGKNRIEGFRRSSSWAKDQTVYFAAEFSRPFEQVLAQASQSDGAGSSTQLVTSSREIDTHGKQQVFQFTVAAGEKILLKVAISSVSIEGARKNLAAELPGWDFDKVRADARAAWNKELSKIEVLGGTDAQTRTFYTALYHTMIHPSLYSDVDGSYRGHDGKIHNINDDGVSDMQKPARSKGGTSNTSNFQRSGGPQKRSSQPPDIALTNGRASAPSDQYTVFSLWDTFRAAHPLYTIIDQKRTVDFINTFIRIYEQGGRLPVWELWGNETDCMIGYHAVSAIADAMAKGIKGFDYEKAYEAAKHSAELDRDGLDAYKKRGYISSEDSDASVSKTLEYAYDDDCIAYMALTLVTQFMDSKNPADQLKLKELGADLKEFSRRSQSFQNLFDPSTGFMRPRRNGGFVSPFAPNEVTFNYTEGNAWVYSFFVPEDYQTLIRLEGGEAGFAKKLDELFTTSDKLIGREQPDITGLIGQYAHGNEPSHHIAYLYDMTESPWKTQLYVRKILNDFYKPTPDGLIGNEDCGQMSAWYVLSATGFYSWPPFAVNLIGAPLFKEIRYHLENGKTFTIRAPNNTPSNAYVRSVRLNGKLLTHPEFTHNDIMNGGTLDFDMSPEPVRNAFRSAGNWNGDAGLSVPVPIIGDGRLTFQKSMTLSMQDIAPGIKIYYTLDGSEPDQQSTLYSSPISIKKTTQVKAIAVSAKGKKSPAAEANYRLIPNNWTVRVHSKYSNQYTGGGDEGLIDGIRGTTTFASGEWQGYQGQDFIATVDLQKETEIHNLGAGFLQVAGSWIWMPTFVQFEVSDDGVNFRRVVDIKTDVPVTEMDPIKRDYTRDIPPAKARYVRVHAYNLGKIPAWHPGAGGDAWIFVDEILIN
jgi:putative alpha-1,2-mannosidase